MPVFVIIIVIALAMYIFYKVKTFRTKAPAQKRWIQTKANIALGTFVGVFGLNILFTQRGTVDIVVGTIFLLLGAANVLLGMKAYKLYLPYAAKEAEEERLKA
ncbi:YtpI family protein [Aliibacillus thermotolerans]|uniref:YtpI family protein n=1 Tax=Aliibacillus thermotolerans TaxID=1834418 RepID=A0ABW0U9Y8_9BACI|nr:YtpI family protein [Aliibacillus thermotolerans]MDA3129812.1 hypothetical protein [Aliibacillus thermotolerans]